MPCERPRQGMRDRYAALHHHTVGIFRPQGRFPLLSRHFAGLPVYVVGVYLVGCHGTLFLSVCVFMNSANRAAASLDTYRNELPTYNLKYPSLSGPCMVIRSVIFSKLIAP